MNSRTLTWLAASFVLLSICDCGYDPTSHYDPPMAPSAPTTAQAVITPASQTANVGDTVIFEGRVTGSLASGASSAQMSWQIYDIVGTSTSKVASLAAKDDVNQQITVRCNAPGTTNISLSAASSAAGIAAGYATLTCNTAPQTTTPPSNAPSVNSIIGAYTKRGKRVSTTCTPPMFTDWSADLTVETSTDGNLGIRFRQDMAGTANGGSFTQILLYSQFTAGSGPDNALVLTSGDPVRSIFGKDVITHIEVTFKPDGSITGTETFVGPDGCKETYELSGNRK